MKFLIDAQLPRRLVQRLRKAGFQAIHMLDLPLGNRTPDTEINSLSIREQYIVVTKDADFVSSFHLHRQPTNSCWFRRAISRNAELEALFLANLDTLSKGFEVVGFIELNRSKLIFHS